MADELIQGVLDVEHPGAATPFTLLAVNTASFGTVSNLLQSHFIVAKDIGAAPPGGAIAFSVRGDGLVNTKSITATDVVSVVHPGSGNRFDLLTLTTDTFGSLQNAQQSNFITAKDIRAAPPSGKTLFSVRGDGLVRSSAGYQFPDGSVQKTAQATGPRGPQGPQGPPGSLPPTVAIFTDTTGAGQVRCLASDGHPLAAMGANSAAPSGGIVGVTDQSGVIRASIGIDQSGSFVTADVKSFRVEHPVNDQVDIVYACIEGPEAAAYARGTADLVEGRCLIKLPDHFTHVVAEKTLTVQVTPWSKDSLGLAVTSRTRSEVVVEELQGGKGTYRFDWTVFGVRVGHEDYQVLRQRSERLTLVDVDDPSDA